MAIEEAVAESGIGRKGSFPGPLFLAVAPVEIEWPHREALAADAGANEAVGYDDLLRAAASGRFRAVHERCLFGSVAEHLSERFGTHGSPISLSTACASGASAIQLGVEAIRRGETDAALCVGTDASVNPEALIRFSLLSALSTQNDPPQAAVEAVCQEPRRLRHGGRRRRAGAGKPQRRASARRRASSACIEGCGEMADSFHRTRSSPDGKPIIGCMRNALARCRARSGRDRLHQPARHRHAGERQDGAHRRRSACSASAPSRSRSRPTSR